MERNGEEYAHVVAFLSNKNEPTYLSGYYLKPGSQPARLAGVQQHSVAGQSGVPSVDQGLSVLVYGLIVKTTLR
ncbi:MAG: hypothetical protein R2849_04955 [Thermomicrobiales bacterium]